MNIDSIQLITTDELAKILNVSQTTIYRIIEARKIPFYRVSGSIRFDKKDVANYLNEKRVESIN